MHQKDIYDIIPTVHLTIVYAVYALQYVWV